MILQREAELEEIFKTAKEPWSVVLIGHQYLSLFINLTLAIMTTQKRQVSDKVLFEIDKIPFPTRLSLLVEAGILKKDTTEKLEQINSWRNKFAHKIFTEKGEEFVKEHLTDEFLEKYKQTALSCITELKQAYELVYEREH